MAFSSIVIQKQVGNDEVISQTLYSYNPVTGQEDAFFEAVKKDYFDETLQALDKRMFGMNLRMLEAYGFEKYFAPEHWQQTLSVLEVFAGIQRAEDVLRRWQSIKEENDDLERMRVEAFAHVNGEVS